jgi:hypothetical protein
MRHKLYTIVRLVGTGSVLFSVSAWAETPLDGNAERWDDSHMQSNFARRTGALAPRVIVGSTRYDETASAPPARVEEQLLSLNPHGWTPGGGTSIGNATPRWTQSNPKWADGHATADRSTGGRGVAGGPSGSRSSRR